MLPEERLDDALYRVLYNRFRLGEFDPPEMVPFSKISPDVICSDEHRELALKAAREAVVLLVNRDNFLPLDKGQVRRIAVIGPHADTFTSGNYSGLPDNPVTPLQGIRNHAAEGAEILYARGCGITDSGSTNVDREDGFSRGRSVKLNAEALGEYLQFPIEVPAPGTYEIRLRCKTFEGRGMYRLSIDGIDQGEPFDLYSPSTDYDHEVNFGTKVFDRAGDVQFRFTVVGRNERSSSFSGHFDRIILAGESERGYEVERLDYVAGLANPGDSIERATEIARGADVAIVYVGTSNAVEREGRDRTSLSLPGQQEDLVKAIVAANPRTVVVLMNAGPLTVPWIKENVPAVLEAWWHGVEGANAVAEVLFGDVNPAGRLPHTVYASESQVPSQDEYDVSKGFTYMYLKGEPLFAFGHGLSYTQFEYANLQVSPRRIAADGAVTVSVEVENIGSRAGDEVVQLYVHDVECSVTRPTKELRGFERISLEPDQKKTVTFTLEGKQLAFWDEVNKHDFVVEPGLFDIMVGSSSDDIRARGQLEITASP
jgi:beta-glucosidase